MENLLTYAHGVVASKERSDVHRDGLLHYCVHMICFNDKGVYLQRRSASRTRNPGAWTSTVSGHIAFEDSEGTPRVDADVARIALEREFHEELGVSDASISNAEYLGIVRSESFGASEICRCSAFVFKLYVPALSVRRTEEVDELRLFSAADVALALRLGHTLRGSDHTEHPLADNFAPVFERFAQSAREMPLGFSPTT